MNNEMRVFVYGSGSWGTALAAVLSNNGVDALVYGRNSKEVEDINQNHQNKKYFPDDFLPESLKATTEVGKAVNYNVILLAVPSNACKGAVDVLNGILKEKTIFVNVAKGFDPETSERLSQSLIKHIDSQIYGGYYALIGPSHAEEVVKNMLTTINIVGEDNETAVQLQQLFSNDYFRVYRNSDLIGCEYAAGLKNIIALASGMLYGLNLGDNAKASLMTRGLSEMSRFGLAHGGKLESFIGLCGMGDLIVTCTSPHSRNWQAGYQIGRENSSEGFWATNTKTVEGVNACKIIYQQAQKEQIEMPITSEVYRVLFEKKKPSDAIKALMTRSLKAEIY